MMKYAVENLSVGQYYTAHLDKQLREHVFTTDILEALHFNTKRLAMNWVRQYLGAYTRDLSTGVIKVVGFRA